MNCDTQYKPPAKKKTTIEIPPSTHSILVFVRNEFVYPVLLAFRRALLCLSFADSALLYFLITDEDEFGQWRNGDWQGKPEVL
jgi:hypothetical protein